MTTLKFSLGAIMLALSGIATAHPGHDHSAWSSNLIHTSYYFVGILALIGISIAVKKLSNKPAIVSENMNNKERN